MLDTMGGVFDNLDMDIARALIDLDVSIVSVRCETDQFVGPQQTTEPVLVCVAGRKCVGFVDDNPGQKSMRLECISQSI